MSNGIILALVLLLSLIAVPAGLRAYARVVKRFSGDRGTERTTSLDWVRRAERFWFRISPLVLIAAAAIAAFLGMRAR